MVESSSELSEEDFTKARICLSTLHCEARTLKEQRDILEQTEREARDRAESFMKELSACRVKISQVRLHSLCFVSEVLTRRLPLSSLKLKMSRWQLI